MLVVRSVHSAAGVRIRITGRKKVVSSFLNIYITVDDINITPYLVVSFFFSVGVICISE